VDHDEKNIRISGKLFAQQADKIEGRIPIVDRQSTANPNYAYSFPGCGRDFGSHRALEGQNVLAAVSLFG
jgi:hypothetical protein